MAEPLEQLLAQIRQNRPRRRAQYEPFQGFSGGNSPGMRGAINPLDSQQMADMAQGVDISSVAPPTRLRAGRIDEDAYDDEANLGLEQTDRGEESPFRTASASNTAGGPVRQTQYRMDCSSGTCRRVPVMEQSQPQYFAAPPSQALPPGVVLGPGETFVPDSLREVTSAPAATTAAIPQVQQMAAPASAAQPEVGGPLAGLGLGDPMQYITKAESQYDMARGEAAVRSPYSAALYKDQAKASLALGMLALKMQLDHRAAGELARQFDETNALAKKRTEIASGEFEEKERQRIREKREWSAAKRAAAIAERQAVARAQLPSQPVLPPNVAKNEYDLEFGLITAMDMAHYLSPYIDAVNATTKAAATGGDSEKSRMQGLLQDARMRDLAFQRYGNATDDAGRPLPKELRNAKMRSELAGLFINTYREKMGKDASDLDVAEAVDVRLRELEGALDHMKEQGASPYHWYFSQGGTPKEAAKELQGGAPAKGASMPAPQEEPAPESPAPTESKYGWGGIFDGMWSK